MKTFETGTPPSSETRVHALLDDCEKIVDRHAQSMTRPIFDLDADEQQAVVDQLNAYLDFEFSQADIPAGTEVIATGTGLLLVCDESGMIHGAETISHGDVVSGEITDMVVLPVPTFECVLDGSDEGVLTYDQVLSSIVLLGNATYKTGLRSDGLFELEHDLSQYQIGIVMAHPLEISVVAV